MSRDQVGQGRCIFHWHNGIGQTMRNKYVNGGWQMLGHLDGRIVALPLVMVRVDPKFACLSTNLHGDRCIAELLKLFSNSLVLFTDAIHAQTTRAEDHAPGRRQKALRQIQ